ncbi:unnamed protein product [Ilex paraguariensis]|uniref:Uncharacterized protein n=1 Tax=Ilex paraguariensis TaxID=185542 RepID=A0ABC8S3U4_9AQUA
MCFSCFLLADVSVGQDPTNTVGSCNILARRHAELECCTFLLIFTEKRFNLQKSYCAAGELGVRHYVIVLFLLILFYSVLNERQHAILEEFAKEEINHGKSMALEGNWFSLRVPFGKVSLKASLEICFLPFAGSRLSIYHSRYGEDILVKLRQDCTYNPVVPLLSLLERIHFNYLCSEEGVLDTFRGHLSVSVALCPLRVGPSCHVSSYLLLALTRVLLWSIHVSLFYRPLHLAPVHVGSREEAHTCTP